MTHVNIYRQSTTSLTSSKLGQIVITPKRYSSDALGGPLDAELEAIGDFRDIAQLFAHMRSPVKIYDNDDDMVWYGYIMEVVVNYGGAEFGLSIDGMANKIKVIYTRARPGFGGTGESAETDWESDSASQSLYGIMEKVISMGSASDDVAEQRRSMELESLKEPIKMFHPTGSQDELAVARITCAGWVETLKWQFYTNLNGVEAYQDTGDGTVNLNKDEGNDTIDAVAQSFQLSAAWDCASVTIRVGKNGSPTGTLTVSLCSDSGGNPGATLKSANISETNLNTSVSWTTFEFSSRESLSASTTYWIKIESDAAASEDNYISVDVNEDLGYTSGSLKQYVDSSWGARDPDADMLFSVNGEEEVSVQLANMFEDWQFVGQVLVKETSGVYQSQYRTGESTIYDCVMELVDIGSSNNRRMVFWIDEDLNVIVEEEDEKPTSFSCDYEYWPDGTVRTRFGTDVSDKVPCRTWCSIGVADELLEIGLTFEFVPFFIERTEYDCEKETVSLEARDQPTVWGFL